MITSVRTKLPLYRWAQVMGLHPLHFAQINWLPTDSQPMACQAAWFRYNWQDADRTGRDEVAEAIARAEADIEHWIGYNLVPDWTVDERIVVTRPINSEFVDYGTGDVRGYASSLVLPRAHFIAGGIRAASVIALASAITYTDANGDGYAETATVTVAVPAGTEPCEVRIYYPGTSASDLYEIRPTTVAVVATTATCVFRREQAVLESLEDSFGPVSAADGLDDANFLTTVDVYRVYNDTTTQASFLWEQLGSCGCLDSDCSLCQYSTQTGCLIARDNRSGIVAMRGGSYSGSTFSPESWAGGRNPDIVRAYYLSGYQDQSRACPRTEMSREWERTVAIYAASMLERPLCDCSAAERVENWRDDVAFTGGAEGLSTFAISGDDLNNPFGTRRGAIYAWKRVQQHIISRSSAANV